MSAYDCRPTSRGTIKLTGEEMAGAPGNPLQLPHDRTDRRVAIDAMRFTRKLMRAACRGAFQAGRTQARPGNWRQR